VNKAKLLEVLRDLQLLENLIGWVRSFLTGRKIQLAFDGQIQLVTKVTVRIPQGSPISLILFLLYMRDIVADSCFQLSYIDNFYLIVSSTSPRKNCKRLESIIDRLLRLATDKGV
jgi:hypothetical protein